MKLHLTLAAAVLAGFGAFTPTLTAAPTPTLTPTITEASEPSGFVYYTVDGWFAIRGFGPNIRTLGEAVMYAVTQGGRITSITFN